MTHIKNHKGRRVGMLGADVSLEWLREHTKRIDTENHERFERGFKEKSYSFVIDHAGTFLIHPDENRVLKQKLQDVTLKTPSLKDDLMARQMMAVFVTLFMGVLILAIVKLLGGKIWLDPDYTEGSRFIFDVPKK